MLSVRSFDQYPSTVSGSPDFLGHLLGEYQYRIRDCIPGAGVRNLYYDAAEDTLIISNIATRRVHLINLTTGTLRWHDHHETTVRHITRYRNDIITCSWDGTVRMVDFHTLSERLVLTQRRMGRSPFVTVTSDGKYLFSFSYDVEKDPLCRTNIVRQWSYPAGEMLRIFAHTGVHKSGTRSGVCLPVGDRLYIISNSGYLNLFDLPSGRLVKETSIAGDFRTMCMIPEFDLIVASETHGSVFLYNLTTNRIFASWRIHQNDITCIKVPPGRPQYLITCSFDGTVKIWEMPGFHFICVLPIDHHELWVVEFIGDLLVVGSTSGYLYFYDISDISAIRYKAKLFLSDQAFALFPEDLNQFYSNDLTIFEISHRVDPTPLGEKEADYLLQLFNSRNALEQVFGRGNPLGESGTDHPKIIRQIPEFLS